MREWMEGKERGRKERVRGLQKRSNFTLALARDKPTGDKLLVGEDDWDEGVEGRRGVDGGWRGVEGGRRDEGEDSWGEVGGRGSWRGSSWLEENCFLVYSNFFLSNSTRFLWLGEEKK